MRHSMTVVATLVVFTAFALVTTLAGCKDKENASAVNTHDHEHTGIYVNARCPIMDSAITDRVPASLVREHKGGKVAFCCAACLPAWDKLSDPEKEAKLKAVGAR
jgi:hypothetical protein